MLVFILTLTVLDYKTHVLDYVAQYTLIVNLLVTAAVCTAELK